MEMAETETRLAETETRPTWQRLTCQRLRLTRQRQSSTGLFVLVVFVFLELRDKTKLRTPTSLGKIRQRTLKTETGETDR